MQADAVVTFVIFGGDALFEQRITHLGGNAGTAIGHFNHQLIAVIANIEFYRFVRRIAMQRSLYRIIQQITDDRHQFGFVQRRRDLPQLAGGIKAQFDAFFLRAGVFAQQQAAQRGRTETLRDEIEDLLCAFRLSFYITDCLVVTLHMQQPGEGGGPVQLFMAHNAQVVGIALDLA
ncbi:hypothetical protein D3C80_1597960 [compost metagenome]